jgi:hypothetical protein
MLEARSHKTAAHGASDAARCRCTLPCLRTEGWSVCWKGLCADAAFLKFLATILMQVTGDLELRPMPGRLRVAWTRPAWVTGCAVLHCSGAPARMSSN